MVAESVPSSDGPAQGCWVDLFELTQFRGRRRRLYGPADYPRLRSGGTSWGIQIESLIIGPAAHVLLYDMDDFENSVTWFVPGKSVPDVIQFNVASGINSIRIVCDPPTPDESSYASYARASGGKLPPFPSAPPT